MSEGKYAIFNLGPKIVEQKAKYRDEKTRKNLTYNLATDPRVKRGPNFGVEFVTNIIEDENEAAAVTKKYDQMSKSNDTTLLTRTKKLNEERQEIPPPEGRCHLGVNTSKVVDTVRPKPLTFEVEVQTKDYIDRPQTPLFWPQKTGEDKETQIEDGELFDFDVEVEPILNVLTSKILEQSRMEVLEEEEIKEMKRQQKEFEIKRNRELQEVQKLENEEIRKTEERARRAEEKRIRIARTIVNQKKLFARTIAKEYLTKLKTLSLKQLAERGSFKNPENNQYHFNLLPLIQKKVEEIHAKEYVIVNKLETTFKIQSLNVKLQKHREAIIKERTRKENIEKKRIENMELARIEKQRKKEEAKRIQKEKEIAALRQLIQDELLVTAEYLDEPFEVLEINGYYQKGMKYSPVIGGVLCQFALIFTHLNKIFPDFINEEKVTKILELFAPKSIPINIIYTQEELEEFKKLDGNINSIEDILKSDEAIYTEIIKVIHDHLDINDEVLPLVLEELTAQGYEGIKDMYSLIMKDLLKLMKISTDISITEKIRFILKDTTVSDDNYAAVCLLNSPIITKPKLPDLTQPVPIAKKVNPMSNKKSSVITKVTFEPSYPHKTMALTTFNEKVKIIAINNNFEKMLRNNIIDCTNKLFKLDSDKEGIVSELEENYSKFLEQLSNKLATVYKKEKLEMNLEAPVVNN